MGYGNRAPLTLMGVLDFRFSPSFVFSVFPCLRDEKAFHRKFIPL
jgi:hypothetical protein